MRQMLAVIATVAVVAACSDRPITQPESARAFARAPMHVTGGSLNGAIHWRFDANQMWCNVWDTDGGLHWVNCDVTYRDNGFSWVMKTAAPIPNTSGRAAVFNSTHYPQGMVDLYALYLGVSPRNGVMPVCDWNMKTYYSESPDIDMAQLACTTNWRYTISASGQGLFTAMFDASHTYYPFAP